jgi:hypothetical protein
MMKRGHDVESAASGGYGLVSASGSAGNNTFLCKLVTGTDREEGHSDTGDANLPRYYFSIRWGNTTRHDPSGTCLPTNAAVSGCIVRRAARQKSPAEAGRGHVLESRRGPCASRE